MFHTISFASQASGGCLKRTPGRNPSQALGEGVVVRHVEADEELLLQASEASTAYGITFLDFIDDFIQRDIAL